MKTILLMLASLMLMSLATQVRAGDAPDDFFTPKGDKDGLVNPEVTNPGRPNVLILGDSISIGYTPGVRERLKDKANVIRPSANCGDTKMGLAGIEKWLGDTRWDVIHFNWGLWDLCYRNPKSKEQGNRDKVNGTLSTAPEQYEKNLTALVQRLQKTGAVLIWASTTMVPEGEVGRFVGDDVKYNAIAERVMTKHGVMINDLYAVTKEFAPSLFTKPGDVHFTKDGYAKLATHVAAKVLAALKTKVPPTKP